MQRAYIYTRVSTAMQADNFSIEAQKTDIEGYCKYKDIQIVGDYSDAGYSGKNAAGRPAFMQMIQDIEDQKDKIDYVIVFKLSRFGRNAADTLNYVQLLEDYNIHLICTKDGTSSETGNGKLMINMLSSMAELERENIHVQTMAGRRQKAVQGGWNGGFAPYGYALIDGKLVIQEDEAAAVREMYRLYVETDMGFNGVAKQINETFGKKPRQNGYLTKFATNIVRQIIVNPVYKGTLAFGRRVTEKIEGERNVYHVIKQKDPTKIIYTPGAHPAIVTEELWDAANAKAAINGVKKEKIFKDHEYILSGLVKCPYCGDSMYGVPNGTKINKWGEKYRPSYSYKCRNRLRESGHVCPGKSQYSCKKVDEAVRDIIMDMVSQENFSEMLSSLLDKQVDRDSILAELEQVEKDIRRYTLARTKANNQLLNLDYDSPVADQEEEILNQRLMDAMVAISEAENKKATLNYRLLEIGNAEAARKSVYDFLSVFKDLYDQLTDAEKKETMQALISSVELHTKEYMARSGQWIKAIHFKFPISYHGEIVEDIELDENGHIFRPNQSTDETVALLRRKNVDDYLEFTWTDEEFGNNGCKASYEEIKFFILEKYELKVSHLNIAQIKRKCGIIERLNYNLPKTDNPKVPNCTPEKEAAIMDAFRHFKLI